MPAIVKILILTLLFSSCEKKAADIPKLDFNTLFSTKTIAIPDTVGMGHFIPMAKYKTKDLLYLFDRGVSAFFKIDFKKNTYKRILKRGSGPNELQSTQNITFSDSNTIFWGNAYTAALNEIDLDGKLIQIRKLPKVSAGFPSQIFEGKHYFKQSSKSPYQVIDDEGNLYVKTPALFQTFSSYTNPGFHLVGNKIYFMIAYEAVVHSLDLKTKKHNRIELKLPIELNHYSDKYNQSIDRQHAKTLQRQSLSIVKFIPFLSDKAEQRFLLYCNRGDVGTWLFLLDENFDAIVNIQKFPYVEYLTSYKEKVLLYSTDRNTGDLSFVEIKLK
jgi:hypothetical protein